MQQFPISLKNTGCVLAILTGISSSVQAQTLNLNTLIDSQGKIGGQTGLYIPLAPLSSLASGIPYVSVGGGLWQGRIQGSGLVGYRQSLGSQLGFGGYAGASVIESQYGNKFVNAVVGGEVYYGGLSLGFGGYVPVGGKQVASGRKVGGILLDPAQGRPGSCDPTGTQCLPPVTTTSCSQPLPGQVRVCEIGISVTDKRYERAKAGFNVSLGYDINGAGWAVRPVIEYSQFGRKEEIREGVGLTVALGNRLMLTAEGGAAHGVNADNIRGYIGLGLSYQFGGGASFGQQTAIERHFNQAPRVNNNSKLQIQQDKANTTIYRTGNTPANPTLNKADFAVVGSVWKMTGQKVSEVWIIDQTNQKLADEMAAMAKAASIGVFDGSKGFITLDDQVSVKQEYTGLVTGGSVLEFSSDMGDFSMAMPGSAATIVQPSTAKSAFYLERFNDVLIGLNIIGGSSGVSNAGGFTSVRHKIFNTTVTNANVGFLFKDVDGLLIQDSKAVGSQYDGFNFDNIINADMIGITNIGGKTPGRGISINRGQHIFLRDMAVGSEGLTITDSDNITAIGVNAQNSSHSGIYVSRSDDIKFYNTTISNKIGSDALGILLNHSNNVNFFFTNITGGSAGINIFAAQNVNIFSATIDIGNKGSSGTTGIAVGSSDGINPVNVNLSDVNISKAHIGVFVFGGYDITLSGSITDTIEGVYIGSQVKSAKLEGLTIDQRNNADSVGVEIYGAGDILHKIGLEGVYIANSVKGAFLNKAVVVDLGGNVFDKVSQPCDGVTDSSAPVKFDVIGKASVNCQ